MISLIPSPELAHVIDHLQCLAAEVGAAVDIEGARRVLNRFGDLHPSLRDFDADVFPVRVADVPCEWLLASSADPDRRLLYIHGGGWTSGSLDSHRPLSARLSAATGCAVLSVDYRLAPEHPYPAGLDDCLDCYDWLRENGPAGAGPARSIFVAGDSAGGNLTLAVLLALKQRGSPLPNAAVTISPATDFLATGNSYRTRADRDPILTMGSEGMRMAADIYLQGNAKLDDPLVSPLYGDFAGLPPLLFQVGDAEVLLDDSTQAAEKARLAGIDVTLHVYPNMPHVWHTFAPYLPEATQAIGEIGSFVRKYF